MLLQETSIQSCAPRKERCSLGGGVGMAVWGTEVETMSSTSNLDINLKLNLNPNQKRNLNPNSHLNPTANP